MAEVTDVKAWGQKGGVDMSDVVDLKDFKNRKLNILLDEYLKKKKEGKTRPYLTCDCESIFYAAVLEPPDLILICANCDEGWGYRVAPSPGDL